MRTGIELLRDAANVLDVRGFNLSKNPAVAVADYFRRVARLTSEIREYLAVVDGKEHDRIARKEQRP